MLIAAVACVGLVASAIAAFTISDDGAFDPAATSGVEREDKVVAPDEWDERVVDLVAFVEGERELEFEEPVQVDFLTEEEFREELRYDDHLEDSDLEELEEGVGMLRAYGLIAADLDLLETLDEYRQAAVLAFYDDQERRIVVPTTDPTIVDDVILVHELTHALQDQHFDLSSLRPDPDADDDEDWHGSVTAITALIEGDARRVEAAYLNSLGAADRAEFFAAAGEGAEETEEALSDIPTYIVASGQAPYSLGHPFVSLIHADGGNAAVDRAFGDPPTTGMHLLDPRRYIEDEPSEALDPPGLPGGSEAVDEGEFDALDVYVVLAERLDLLTALDAADGWRRGSYAVYDSDSAVCVRFAVEGRDDDDDARLAAAFEEWAEQMPEAAGATVDDGTEGGLEAASCDPGPQPSLPNDRSLLSLELVAMRSSIAWELVEFLGEDLDEAWEVSSCVMVELVESDIFADDDQDAADIDPLPDLEADLDAAFEAAFGTCYF